MGRIVLFQSHKEKRAESDEVKLKVLVLIAMEESKVRVGIESYY